MPQRTELFTRTATLDCRAVEDSTKQYEISFSSEAPYLRWNGPEILAHTADAVDLSLLQNGGSLLFSHGLDPIFGRLPVGKIVRVWLDETAHKCRAVIELDDEDEQGKRLAHKLEKGMLSGVSVGYRVAAWMELRSGQTSTDGRFTGPAHIAVKWTPHEISLEPTPADTTVGLGKSIEMQEQEETEMPLRTEVTNGAGSAVQQAAAPLQGEHAVQQAAALQDERSAQPVQDNTAAQAVSAERTRMLEIGGLCRSFGVEEQTMEEYIRSGSSVDAVRAAIVERMQAQSGPVQAGTRGDVQLVKDELDRVRAAAVDGLLLRSANMVAQPAPGADSFRGMSLQQIAVECLARGGERQANRLSKDELFRRSLTPNGAFVSVMAEVANRVVLGAHQAAQTTFQLWTSKGSASDFRPTDYYEISEGGELVQVPENGELKEAKLSDKAIATRRLLTFGRKISFTRQLFINDDIGLVTRTLQSFALAFARGTNRAVYALLGENPTMKDGQTLFSAGHGNLGSGAAISTASFSAARKAMRTQKDLSGNVTLNIAPAFVLCSAADEVAVQTLLHSLADPSGSNSGVVNVFRNSMQPVIDAELDVDNGAQPYYFAANPTLTPTIEVAYLNGNEAPTVESQVGFETLGITFRVFGDRAVTLLGYRGLYKNPGTVSGGNT